MFGRTLLQFCFLELEAQQEKLRIMREKCEAKVVPKNVKNKIDKKFNKIKQRLKHKETQLKEIEEVSFFFYKCNAKLHGNFSARKEDRNRKN